MLRNILKKTVITAFATLLIFAQTGCVKKTYDIQLSDCLDISVFGENGSGYIEVHRKEMSPADFEHEGQYEALSKNLDRLNTDYIPGETSNRGGIIFSKLDGISNDDEITVKFQISKNFKWEDIEVGTDPYTFTVSGLKDELKTIDLFDEEHVRFVGNPDANDIAALVQSDNSGDFDKSNYFKYTIVSKDSVEQGSKFTAMISMTETAKNLFGYSDVNVFLAKNGYKIDSLTKELTLDTIQNGIDAGGNSEASFDTQKMKDAIGKAMNEYGQGPIGYTDIVAIRPQPGVENGFFVYYYLDDGSYVDYFEKSFLIYDIDGSYEAEVGNYSRYVTYAQVMKYLDKCVRLSENMPSDEDNPKPGDSAEDTSEEAPAEDAESGE